MHLVDRRSVTRPTAAEAALEAARAVTLAKFVRFGFTAEQAAAMARADLDLLFVPAPAVGL